MNTTTVWVILPALTAFGLIFLRRHVFLVTGLGIAVALLLAYSAWKLPINESIRPLPLVQVPSFQFDDTFTFLGRRFILDEFTRPALVLIYLGSAFWFGGVYPARTNPLFVPLGLLISSFLVASIAVQPFLYSALIILGVALLCVPILSPPGSVPSKGVFRFLVFQVMGMPMILTGGLILSQATAVPAGASQIFLAGIIIGLGFALISAVFPFHTWITMVAEESHPYATAFVLFLVPSVMSLLSMEFITSLARTGSLIGLIAALRLVAVIMILFGGIFAGLERHLARIMGFAAIYEIGLTLLSLSLAANPFELSPVKGLFFAILLPRLVGLAVWAIALSFIRQIYGGLSFEEVAGSGRRYPIISASLVLVTFSVAGLPFLAGFPTTMAVWSILAGDSPLLIFFLLVGAAGLILAALRTILILFKGSEGEFWGINENGLQIFFLASGIFALIFIGLFPQFHLPLLTNMALIFTSTAP